MNILQRFYTQTVLNKEKRGYNILVIALLAIFLIIISILSISIGSSNIPLKEIISAILGREVSSNVVNIVNFVRIPRTIAAILSGCALSISGIILQSVLNNSLASPNTIGVNAGAGLFTVLTAAYLPNLLYLTPIAAFIGGMLSVGLVYFIARKTGASRITIILSGIAVSSFIGAITDTILTLWPDTAISRIEFLIGGFSGVTMDIIKLPGILIILASIITLILSVDMNVLALGDETAASLGLNVPIYRFIFLMLASLLAGSSISYSGLLGFIGIIVPHTARFLVANDNRILIPVCGLLGSSFMLFCDLLSRVLFAPFEIPVGIIMSFLGGPFFIYLLLNQKRGRIYD